jgi:hypothetical protein
VIEVGRGSQLVYYKRANEWHHCWRRTTQPTGLRKESMNGARVVVGEDEVTDQPSVPSAKTFLALKL